MKENGPVQNTKWMKADSAYINGTEPIQYLNDALAEDRHYRITNQIYRKEQPINGLTARGLILAKTVVNNYRRRYNLPESGTQMQVIFLNRNDFRNIYNQIQPGESNLHIHPDGFNHPDIPPVVIVNDISPLYQKIATAGHELAHKHLDLKVRVFAPSDHGYIYESRRSGMALIDTRDPERKTKTGELLNEMGNAVIQKEIMLRLLGIKDFEHDALIRRYQLMANYQLDSENMEKVPVVNRQKILQFNVENIHFNHWGEAQNMKLPYLMMQLVDDIADRVGLVDGLTFSEALIKAKTNPAFQSKIMLAVDAAIQPGFYARLKQTDPEPKKVLDLIHKVQNPPIVSPRWPILKNNLLNLMNQFRMDEVQIYRRNGAK